MCRNRLKKVLSYGKLICTSIVVVLLLMCTTIPCNAEETEEEYSSVPYINVKLSYGNTYYNGNLVYKEEKVDLNFKEDPSSPAIIDITTTKGPYNFLGQYSFSSLSSPNTFESVLGDMLVDDMSEYYSINSKKTEIRILPKSAKEWNAIEKKLGITEENYTSKTVNIGVSAKSFSLNIETSDIVENNPKILTTERYAEDLKYVTNKYKPALRYMHGSINYQQSVIEVGNNYNKFYPEPKINIYYWNALKTGSSTRKLGLNGPVNILDYVDKDVFYAPAYEVDALYTLSEDDSTLVPAEIESSWLGDKTIYPHWKRKEGYSSIQIYSEQNIKDSEKPVSAVNKDKLDEITELVSGLVESNSVDSDSINTISDWFGSSSGRIYDWNIRNTLYNCILQVKAEIESEEPDNDVISGKMESILDALEDMQAAQEEEYDISNRVYPNGGGTFYETEFLSSEGVTEGNEIPKLNLTPSKSYKFKGWKVYEWSDKDGKFVDSVKYPDIVKPEDFEESSEDDSEEEKEKEKFLQTGYNTDYYLVAQWEKSRSIHFDIEGKIIGEPAESGGDIITPDYDTMYVLNDDYIDIESPSRENYDFAGWYVKTKESDKEGVFIEPNEDDEYSMQEIIEKANYPGYSTDTYYYLMASWKRIYDNGEGSQGGTGEGQSEEGNNGEGSSSSSDIPSEDELNNIAGSSLIATFINNGYAPRYIESVKVKNGKSWDEYAPEADACSDQLKFEGWYNSETMKKLDLKSKVNIKGNVTFVSKFTSKCNVVTKVSIPEFKLNIDMVFGHPLSEYNLPQTNGNEKIIGWSFYSRPYSSVLDIEYYPEDLFLDASGGACLLHPVYESDLNGNKPTTTETLTMKQIYRNSYKLQPYVYMGESGKREEVVVTKYNSNIEKNADILFNQIYNSCLKAEKSVVVVCPSNINPSKDSIKDCEYINSGLEPKDFMDALGFMYCKYFGNFRYFYKNSIEANSDSDLRKDDMGGCGYLCIESNISVGSGYMSKHPEFCNYMYYDLKAPDFISCYSRCQKVESKINSIIKELGLSANTTIDEALEKINEYLLVNMAYDDLYDIYDLYWFMEPTGKDRNVDKQVDYHGVCQSYTKFVQAIMDKCGFPVEIYQASEEDGKISHVINCFYMNNTKYYNDYTWSDLDDPLKYMYMTDKDMFVGGHFNPSLAEMSGVIVPNEGDIKEDKLNGELPLVKIKKIKQKKNKLCITLTKQKKATGYELVYSTSKKFKNSKTVKSKSNKITLKNLKPKKKYYFKVRWIQKKSVSFSNSTYKYEKYSKYSKVISKKIKKYKYKKVKESETFTLD